jgi:hypothetical protein
MVFTAFVLGAALATAPPKAAPAPNTGGEVLVPNAPLTPSMNVRPNEPARCAAIVRQALYEQGMPGSGPGRLQTWRPSAYPEAGLYWTLDKTIAGCRVPVRMGFDAAKAPRPKR